MSESVKSRETANPHQLLMSLIELRVSLSSLLDEERRRLRRIPIDEQPTVSMGPWDQSASACVDAAPELPSPTRVEPLIEREPQVRATPAPAFEARPRFTPVAEGSASSAARTPEDVEPPRSENPRKRLDELARLLDKRAKQSAESVLKGSETKEAER